MADIKKKRPGRPKKQKPVDHKPREGIVSAPSTIEKNPEDDTTMEMYYDTPASFRKIFSLLKQFNVKNITMHFDKTQVMIVTKDHVEKNNMVIIIRGERMNRYFCEKRLDIQLGIEEIQTIAESISKDISTISFYSRRKTERSKLAINLFNNDMELDDNFLVDCVHAEGIPADLEEKLLSERDYPLNFCIKSKFLKRKIQTAGKISKKIAIIKQGTGNLFFDILADSKKLENNSVPRNKELIRLSSTVPEGYLFSVITFIDYIKPISAALIADELYVSAHEEKNLIFTAYVDRDKGVEKTEVFIVKIFIDTVDHR